MSYILSEVGFKKFEAAFRDDIEGVRNSFDVFEPHLYSTTVRKIYLRHEGVHHSTLSELFNLCNLVLESEDYRKLNAAIPVSPPPVPPMEPEPPNPLFIERQADRETIRAIMSRERIVSISGPRQSGKTTTLHAALKTARSNGFRVISTDYCRITATQVETPDSFCRALAHSLQVQIPSALAPEKMWNSSDIPLDNLENYVTHCLGKCAPARLIWGMDEVDRIFACEYRHDVYARFRAWSNEDILLTGNHWDRMTLVLTHATEASQLIQNPLQSPFNIGVQISIGDFSREELKRINSLYDNPLKSEDDITQFYRLTGGHPFLVTHGLRTMQEREMSLPALLCEVHRLDGLYGAHLDKMLSALQENPDLSARLIDLLQDKPCRDDQTFLRLQRGGLLKRQENGRPALRCELYRDFLASQLLSNVNE